VPGHFSALGMLLSDLRHDYVRTYYKPLEACDFDALLQIFAEMREEGETLLRSEGVAAQDMSVQLYLDMRYVGQEFPIQTRIDEASLKACDREALRQAFDLVHNQRFGHQAESEQVEVVNCRLTARGKRPRVSFPPIGAVGGAAAPKMREMIASDPAQRVACPAYDRDLLIPGQIINGPACIVEYASTTILFEGDRMEVLDTGELMIHIAEAQQ
jgi:N-methylhydantoinase A